MKKVTRLLHYFLHFFDKNRYVKVAHLVGSKKFYKHIKFINLQTDNLESEKPRIKKDEMPEVLYLKRRIKNARNNICVNN